MRRGDRKAVTVNKLTGYPAVEARIEQMLARGKSLTDQMMKGCCAADKTSVAADQRGYIEGAFFEGTGDGCSCLAAYY